MTLKIRNVKKVLVLSLIKDLILCLRFHQMKKENQFFLTRDCPSVLSLSECKCKVYVVSFFKLRPFGIYLEIAPGGGGTAIYGLYRYVPL